MTLVILTGGIDLSVGAVLALCAVGAAACMMRYDFGTALTVLLVLGLGAFVGIVNGLVTTRFHIQSFITTLAMLGVARGVASLWSGGYAIPLAFGDGAGPGAAELQGDLRRAARSPRARGPGAGLLLPRRRADRLRSSCAGPASAATSTPSAATRRRRGSPASTSTGSR